MTTQTKTTIAKPSDREVVVTRVFDAAPRIVFEAWTTPALFTRWWMPRSIGCELVSFEAEFRTGGTYRLVARFPGHEPMAFFGTYVEVTPPARLVWTNEEGGENGQVTTVTFEDHGGKTLVTVHERYPSKEALEAAGGAAEGLIESFEQLAELLAA